MHACNRFESDLDGMTDENTQFQSKMGTTHKEAKARIAEDKKDRDGIRQKLNTCTNPLDYAAHPSGRPIVNVVGSFISACYMDKQTVVQCQRQGKMYGCHKQAKGHQRRSCVPCHKPLRHSKRMLKKLTMRLWYGSHWKRRIHPSWTQQNMVG